MKILLVTNLCPLYRVGLFELLHKLYDIRFLFYAKEEKNFDGESLKGDFGGQNLGGFHVLPKVRINPGLFWKLIFDDYTHLIKCINGPIPLLASFAIAKLRRKRFILWTGVWHHPQNLFHKFSFPFVNYLYRHSDAIVVYGSHIKKYLVELGVPPQKISIAWQVQDNAIFARPVSEEQKSEKKRELGIKTTRLILFVGRLVEQKGIRILLEAYRLLENRDVSLLIIGRGALEEEVKRAMPSLDRVHHLSHVSPEDLHAYYAISDLLVLPSITTETFKEPWGFVVNEAMCQGCAVITSDAVGAGVGGLVEHGKNGFIVPENDPPALAGALETLLNDNQFLDRMKTRSQEIIREWTYPKMADGFARALDAASSLDLLPENWAIRNSSSPSYSEVTGKQ